MFFRRTAQLCDLAWQMIVLHINHDNSHPTLKECLACAVCHTIQNEAFQISNVKACDARYMQIKWAVKCKIKGVCFFFPLTCSAKILITRWCLKRCTQWNQEESEWSEINHQIFIDDECLQKSRSLQLPTLRQTCKIACLLSHSLGFTHPVDRMYAEYTVNTVNCIHACRHQQSLKHLQMF